jgi:hypothetical protein
MASIRFAYVNVLESVLIWMQIKNILCWLYSKAVIVCTSVRMNVSVTRVGSFGWCHTTSSQGLTGRWPKLLGRFLKHFDVYLYIVALLVCSFDFA